MREVVLDTETTGLNHEEGHRIIEIACAELTNHLPSGRTFHSFFNPERGVDLSATEIHGLRTEDLVDKPVFEQRASEFLAFIGEDPLIIHNAQFDINFLNAELARLQLPMLDLARTIDTLTLARKKFPGAPASLDALCRKFSIDNSAREKHNALLDVELLAQVYIELIGGRQTDLRLTSVTDEGSQAPSPAKPRERNWPKHTPSAEERAAHVKFLEKLTNPLWTS
ncbi:MAG: DNA polymerase III subunit epsilon [Rhodospirillaceae bacterium]|nr:DNA polymerase III subunit epsilon [Rhodospirillaceae bacterium]